MMDDSCSGEMKFDRESLSVLLQLFACLWCLVRSSARKWRGGEEEKINYEGGEMI